MYESRLMNGAAAITALGVLASLSGCASFPIDPRVAGRYSGANSEALIFEDKGSVFHIQTNGAEKQWFLGYYVSRCDDSRTLGFVGPDTSPFLGTSFQFSEDFSTITANWVNRLSTNEQWQTAYRRDGKAN